MIITFERPRSPAGGQRQNQEEAQVSLQKPPAGPNRLSSTLPIAHLLRVHAHPVSNRTGERPRSLPPHRRKRRIKTVQIQVVEEAAAKNAKTLHKKIRLS